MMQGKRVEDFLSPHLLKPGEYSKFPNQLADYWWPGHSYWHVCAPNGCIGTLLTHNIEEHEDGTITVSPSILFNGESGWHGYLERGIWRTC